MSAIDGPRLGWALTQLAQRQGIALDPLALQACVQRLSQDPPTDALDALRALCESLEASRPQALPAADAAHLPLLCHTPRHGWGVALHLESDGTWRVLTPQGEVLLNDEEMAGQVYRVRFDAQDASLTSDDTFMARARHVMKDTRTEMIEAGLASALIGLLALATSLFSMQVYDRVIPTHGEETLVILSLGVLLSIGIEFAMKLARSTLTDYVVVGADNRLSREIFHRLLRVRADQMPASVGSLAGQLRGYEMVRSFYTSSTLFTLIDFPLGLLFLLVMVGVGSPWIALPPLCLGALGVYLGLSAQGRIREQAEKNAAYGNLKTGLLVEAVEGFETIKAGSGHWKFLSRWIDVSAQAIANDMETRNISEKMGYLTGSLQQVSYAGLIIVGALLVIDGQMTMGALIACSILSGRVLSPMLMLPGLLVQHANAQAAIQGLEALYQRETDNHGIARPLVPEVLRGHFRLEGIQFAYGKNPVALRVPRMDIQPGERIAILGQIGSGKSTLLRLLSGMYKPQEGQLLLDGMALSHISRQRVNQKIGYLQQEHRLFLGTLRENLLIGLPDPGDEAIRQAMAQTGMLGFVSQHPKGLDLPIQEGGKGLSGGQRQLVAFTRLVLSDPDVWLLDEPTAHLDDEQERRCIQVLQEKAQAGRTLVIVTHKPSLLPLTTRLVIVAGHTVVMDGSREDVLQRLTQPPTPAPVPTPASVS